MLHAVTSLVGWYLLGWLGRRVWRERTAEAGMYALLVAVLMIAGMYDLLLNSQLLPSLWRTGFYSTALATPVLLGVMACHLALRTVRAAQALRAANESLESRVREASTQIEAQYAREQRLLAERSAAAERERIYRDLHDNLGARLLSLVYGAGDEKQRSLARGALAEMRTIVATAPLEAGRLSELAEEWRLEAELRCEDAGQALGWQREGDARLDGRQRYQLERICRELISNAIEHGRGRRVDVRWRVEADGAAVAADAADAASAAVRRKLGEAADRQAAQPAPRRGTIELTVADDGCGMPAGQAAAAGVMARVADLDGSATWQRAAGGGTVARVRIAASGARGARGASGEPAP